MIKLQIEMNKVTFYKQTINKTKRWSVEKTKISIPLSDQSYK